MLSRICFLILLWPPMVMAESTPQPAYHGHPTHGGRVFYPARTYSATDAAFLSTDPANKSVSGYTLSIANPTHFIDPTGKWPFTELFERLGDIIAVSLGFILDQPELDVGAILDAAGIEGMVGVGADSAEAEAIASTAAESASENLAAASSNLQAVEGALENMAGGIPDPTDIPEGPGSLGFEPSLPEPDVPNPAEPLPTSQTADTVGRSPAQTLAQSPRTDATATPKTINQTLIDWAKDAAKPLAVQGASLGGMYEITKLSEPSPPKKPLPKQK